MKTNLHCDDRKMCPGNYSKTVVFNIYTHTYYLSLAGTGPIVVEDQLQQQLQIDNLLCEVNLFTIWYTYSLGYFKHPLCILIIWYFKELLLLIVYFVNWTDSNMLEKPNTMI